MDHAEAHELLADLALEASNVGTASASEDNDLLSLHVATCDICRADLLAWRNTHQAIEDALATPDGGRRRMADLVSEEPIKPPASLRTAIAAIPAATNSQQTDTAPGPIPIRQGATRRRLSWRTAAPILAAVAVLVIAVAALRDQAVTLDASRAQTEELSQVTAVLGRLLSEPDHRVVSLAAADGTKEGSVAWSNHDLAVITTALTEPSAGEVYRCWIERDGVRSPVGKMWFVGNLAYWTGSLDGWATISLDDGGRFGVSLEPAAGGTAGQPVLTADLPG
jgi:anti-sigma-K factor RskA